MDDQQPKTEGEVITVEPSDIRRIVHDAIEETITEQRKSFDPGRYVTFTQAIISIIGTLVVFLGITFNYISGVQAKIDTESQRNSKLEYQAQISIDDRHDIHARQDHFETTTGEMNQRLARIDAKLDEIKARQTVR